MTETLGKAQLIYMLKKKEMRENEFLEISSIVDYLFKSPSEKALNEAIQKKINQKIKETNIEEPPAYLTCPISFVSSSQANCSGFVLEPSDDIRWVDI